MTTPELLAARAAIEADPKSQSVPGSRNGAIKDLAGKQFTDWTVLSLIGRVNRQTMWLCRCKCNREKPVSSGNLKSGASPRCNHCAKKKDDALKRNPIYGFYRSLKLRKKLAPEWQTFSAFYAAVGPRPKSMRLIRSDPRKPYGPGNGHWGFRLELSAQDIESLRTTDLDERRKAIIALRDRHFTLKQIGDAAGLTRERVRQLSSPNAYARRIAVAKRRIAWHQKQIETWEKRLAAVSHERPPVTIDQAAVDRIEARQ